MLADDELLAFRPPTAFRVAFTVFFAVWLCGLGSFLLSDEEGPPAWRVGIVLMLAFGLYAFVRTHRMAVIARPTELVVRNLWRSYRLDRAEIGGFSTGRHQRIGERTAYADLREGRSVRLLALDPTIPFVDRQKHLEPALDRLEAWRAGAPAPVPPAAP